MRAARIALSLTALFSMVALVTAQTPAPAGAQRGRGRGRVTIQTMTLTTPWAAGGEIPLKYTQAGDEVSPALSWTGVPETVASFVLIVHDVSAPDRQGTGDRLHWMVWNIPGTARELLEGVPQGPQRADGTRQLSVSGPYYRGPAAPASGPPHVYLFELYALDEMIAVPAVGAQGVTTEQTRAAVVEAMVGHIRGKAVTAGQFGRR
ncbi:MAG: YbhB/YbcL family Raf kinase inhibitor-like protein [Acidobacteria bacterium]|jgi:Raf kinase inhibitor-like YbhB/YbcL family protein|nr:YbhB/YbcL family Raf kinase inhibitor-like protein [Acidobacteriota bacterium]